MRYSCRHAQTKTAKHFARRIIRNCRKWPAYLEAGKKAAKLTAKSLLKLTEAFIDNPKETLKELSVAVSDIEDEDE